MKKSLVLFAMATGMAGGMTVVSAGAASAAHCVSPEEDSPGFSYFGTDHVQEADHPEGGNPGPHMGTSGASNCRETTGSPSERAPGRP
jgi:hypothetical protein